MYTQFKVKSNTIKKMKLNQNAGKLKENEICLESWGK